VAAHLLCCAQIFFGVTETQAERRGCGVAVGDLSPPQLPASRKMDLQLKPGAVLVLWQLHSGQAGAVRCCAVHGELRPLNALRDCCAGFCTHCFTRWQLYMHPGHSAAASMCMVGSADAREAGARASRR
jgi:hypothetical protein